MAKVAPGVALRAERHRTRRAVVAIAITGMLGAACGTGAATRAGSGPPASYQQPGSTADCNSVTTCYGPQQIEAAYGIVPLLHRGIDGRGQTVVLPELAEPEFPLPTSDIRQDLVQFDKLFGLPAAKLQVNASLAPSASPWLRLGARLGSRREACRRGWSASG
jgi:hypothetical protein